MEKKTPSQKNHKRVSGSKIELETSIRAASRKLQSFMHKLSDSAVDVAPGKYPKPIPDAEIAYSQ